MISRLYVKLFTAAVFTAGVLVSPFAAKAATVYGLTTGNTVVAFDSSDPGRISYNGPVIGPFDDTEEMIAIDYRPSSGQLVGISNLPALYQIKFGAIVGLPLLIAEAVGDPFSGDINGDQFGMSFNPAVDLVRLVTNQGSNIRLSPATGDLVAQDTNLSHPNIAAIAYDRSYPGAQQTTLYGLDSESNSLVRIGGINGTPSPDGGTVVQIGPLGVDFDSACALDFKGSELLAALRVDGVSMLVSLNPSTGAIIQNYGNIAFNHPIVSMAVAPGFLNAPKMQIKRTFNKPQKDSIKLKALLDIPAGFQVEGTQIHLNIGGVLRSYVLDSKGKAALGQDKIMLKVKSKKGVVEAQQAKLSLKMGGGNYVELEDEGLINTEVKGAEVQVFVSIAYGDELAQQYVPMEYSAKAGKTGKAKN